MLFFKKKPKPVASYTYTQTEDYKGYKRIKLSSYGHEPAEAGIRALSDTDLTGAKIKIDIFEDDYPRAVFSVGKHEVGTIWKRSFGKFNDLKKGKVAAVRLEIRDEDSYLFYKI